MKTKRLLSFLFLTFIIYNFTFNIAEGTVRYVSKTGSSTPPYTSWETAADSIQKAINICVTGDTVIVANGVYYETLIVDKVIWLIGSSVDSSVINGIGTISNRLIDFITNGYIENFTINGRGINSAQDGIIAFNTNVNVKNCRLKNLDDVIVAFSSSSVVENCIITDFKKYSLWDECPNNNCYGVYTNNIIISQNSGASPAVYFSFGGYPTFTNNIVFEEGSSLIGITVEYHQGVVIKNNLVAGYLRQNIDIGTITTDTAKIFNNITRDVPPSSWNGTGITISDGSKAKLGNNVLMNNNKGINSGGDTLNSDFNLYWNNITNFTGSGQLNKNDIVSDPMFVKDTVPNSQLDFDYHLQAYSPAIDAGNPNILDKDGSRSDIGMYGGPLGETYTYQDLAPLAPRNLSAVVDTNQILLKWNKNTESDTSHYNVYRDTVPNFIIDSTKLAGSPTDTFFIHYPPYNNSQYVYKITCTDNQGNESKPSTEILIKITDVNEYPVIVNDYLLYQNYPNPFNPSTMIGYKLKERGYVKLMVYDIKGELVSVLVNKEQSAGYYEVEFRSQESEVRSGIASGIYLYKLEVIGEGRIPVYTEMKKMLMIK